MLLYGSIFKGLEGNICIRWLGPYEVDTIFDNGTIKLTTMDGSQTSLFSNRHHIWLYHQQSPKDSFISYIFSDSEIEVDGVVEHLPTPSST